MYCREKRTQKKKAWEKERKYILGKKRKFQDNYYYFFNIIAYLPFQNF
jgi:hypothetical protein